MGKEFITRTVEWQGVEYTLTELKEFSNTEFNLDIIDDYINAIAKQEIKFIMPDKK